MAKYDSTQPLGPLMAAVYRSWAFVQKDTIQVWPVWPVWTLQHVARHELTSRRTKSLF